MAFDSGPLARGKILDILGELLREGGTGTLLLQQDTTSKFLYLQEGQVIFAASNAAEDKFTQILIDQEKLTADQVALAQERKGARTIGRTLVEMGFISSEDLLNSLITQVQKIASSVAAWDVGSAAFRSGVLPPGVARLPIPTPRLIVDTAESIQDRGWVGNELGGLEAVYERVPEALEAARELPLNPEEARILDLLDGGKTVRRVCGEADVDAFLGARFLLGLRTLQWVRRRGPAAPEEEPPRSRLDLSFLDEVPPAPEAVPEEATPILPLEFPADDQDLRGDLPPEPEPEPEPEAEPAPLTEAEEPPGAPAEPAQVSQSPHLLIKPTDREAGDPAPSPLLQEVYRPRTKPLKKKETRGFEPLEPAPAEPPQGRAGSVPFGEVLMHSRPRRRGLPAPAWLGMAACLVVAAGAAAAWWFLWGPGRAPSAARPGPAPPAAAAPQAPPAAPPISPADTPDASAPAPPTEVLPPAAQATNVPSTPPDGPAPAAAPPQPTQPPPPAFKAPAGGSGRTLLLAGSFAEAAKAFEKDIRQSGRKFTLYLELACQTDTVGKAVAAAGANPSLMIIPMRYQGRDCYRVLWGTYATAGEAEAALKGVPAFFAAEGATPKVSRLALP